ncbi:MAG TPA: ROK family protein [Vampirovibrionales bacterium]
MSEQVIGVDIGGTKIATGLVNAQGQVVSSVTLPTKVEEGKDAVTAQIFSSIQQLDVDMSTVKGIGIGAPGPLKDGVLINPPNIPCCYNYPISKLVTEKYNIPTITENDANAAGYAEMVFGSAKGYKNFVYVTVSTGIGTGIIIDGEIYRGKNSLAGEGGHVTIDYKLASTHAHMGDAGVPGSIESLASGTAIACRVQKKMRENPDLKTKLWDYVAEKSGSKEEKLSKISTYDIAQAIQDGDAYAINVIQDAGTKIGVWLGGIISLLDPEIIVIGGGVTELGEILFDKIKETAPKYTINQFAVNTPIVPASLKENVGIYGAASLVIKHLAK